MFCLLAEAAFFLAPYLELWSDMFCSVSLSLRSLWCQDLGHFIFFFPLFFFLLTATDTESYWNANTSVMSGKPEASVLMLFHIIAYTGKHEVLGYMSWSLLWDSCSWKRPLLCQIWFLVGKVVGRAFPVAAAVEMQVSDGHANLCGVTTGALPDLSWPEQKSLSYIVLSLKIFDPFVVWDCTVMDATLLI